MLLLKKIELEYKGAPYIGEVFMRTDWESLTKESPHE